MKYTVIASCGSFPDLNTAAFAENEINWWDDGESKNQRVCTVAYAATELTKFLRGGCCLTTDEEETFDGKTLILLGKADENACTKKLEEILGRK